MSNSLSVKPSAICVVLATFIKDFHILKRYLPNLLGRFIQLGLRVGFFLLMAKSITIATPELGTTLLTGKNVFLFYLCAMLLLVFRDPSLWTPVNTVLQDRANGTLEYLYSTPISRYAYYSGGIFHSTMVAFLAFIPLFTILAVQSQAGPLNLILILLVCLLVALTLSALGIMMALMALLWRQVSALTNILGMIFEFLGGAYFPVQNLPPIIRAASLLLPYTWGYDLIRFYCFNREWNTLAPLGSEWIILSAQAVIFTIVSRILLKITEQRVKREGFSSL